MRYTPKSIVIAAVALCAAVLPVSAQNSSETTTPRSNDGTAPQRGSAPRYENSRGAEPRSDRVATTGASTLNRADRRFILKAAKLGMEEVQVSRLAAERAGNPQLRQFAQRMVQDHETVNRELRALAQSKGVDLTAEALENRQWDKIAQKKAKEFDEDYVEHLVEAHDDSVDLFEKASKSEDSEIAAFASKHLPTLQQHYSHAKELEKAID